MQFASLSIDGDRLERKATDDIHAIASSKSNRKPQGLPLSEYYEIVSSEVGIHLLIDGYLMGYLEKFVYGKQRYNIYLKYYQLGQIPYEHQGVDFSNAVLLAENVKLRAESLVCGKCCIAVADASVVAPCTHRTDFVSISTGSILYHYQSVQHAYQYAWFLIVDPCFHNRLICAVSVPFRTLNQEFLSDASDESYQSTFTRTCNSEPFNKEILTTCTQDQREVGHFDLKRLTVYLHYRQLLHSAPHPIKLESMLLGQLFY